METDPSQPEPEVARPVESSKESHNITVNSPSESDSNSNPTTLVSKSSEPDHPEAVENTQPMSPVSTKNHAIETKDEAQVPVPVPLTTPTYAPPSQPIHSSFPTPTNIPQPTTTAIIATSQPQPQQPPLSQSGYNELIAPVPNATPPHHPIPPTTHHNMPPHIVPHQGIYNFLSFI